MQMPTKQQLKLEVGKNLEDMAWDLVVEFDVGPRRALEMIQEFNKLEGWPTTFEMLALQMEAQVD